MGTAEGAEHWRERAEEARSRADGMHDPEARAAMLQVASGYELLAALAERWPENDHKPLG